MRTLIFMRHAQAQLEKIGQNDRDRSITIAGMHEIESMRLKINKRLQDVDLVLCSNAKRTRQTLEGFRQFFPNRTEINFDDSLYHINLSDLWKKIQTLPSKHKTVMIIGHNPYLTEMIRNIEEAPLSVFPTCGFVKCESSGESWEYVCVYNTKITESIQV